MTDVTNVRPIRRFEIQLPGQEVQEVTQPRLRTLIRNSTVTLTTSVRERGSEQWALAGDIDDFRADFESAAAARASDDVDRDSISRKRLVSYMALAGLVAGGMMVILAPLCLLIGVFAKFVISWVAFGAVLALGVTNAARIEDPRIIHVTAAGFAGGGLLAWFFRAPGGDFTAVHLAIIGLVGGAALSFAIQLPLQRAIVVTAAATLLFPLAIFAIPLFRPIAKILPLSLGVINAPLFIFVQVIPFAIFGALIGSLIRWSEGDAA